MIFTIIKIVIEIILEILKILNNLIITISETSILTISNILLTVGAVVAAIYAMRTYSISRVERRAIIASEESGYCGLKDENLPFLEFYLKNYGINTAENVNGEIFCYIQKDKDNEMLTPKVVGTFNFNNIKPQNSKMKIEFWEKDLNKTDFPKKEYLRRIKFLVVDITYYDRNLQKSFEENFTWKIGSRYKLLELSPVEEMDFRAMKSLYLSIKPVSKNIPTKQVF